MFFFEKKKPSSSLKTKDYIFFSSNTSVYLADNAKLWSFILTDHIFTIFRILSLKHLSQRLLHSCQCSENVKFYIHKKKFANLSLKISDIGFHPKKKIYFFNLRNEK